MEIALISGKGGTGKSSISAAFATLSEKVVIADCDVDTANLYILFNPVHEEEQVYIGGQKAKIDDSLCTHCGLCLKYCRFDAISFLNMEVVVSEILCEGCKLCLRICPVQAISVVDNNRSRMYSGSFRNGMMVWGHLAPGEENSGKLVNMVREKAKQIAALNSLNTIIIDGPPGIGCPVISAITGVDHVVIVTEPTISGMHDLKRVMEIVTKFNLKAWVIINKYDLNLEMTDQIEIYCGDLDIKVIGKLLFDPQMVRAMVQCKSIIEYAPLSDVAVEICKAYKMIADDR
ncbi:MAG: ATP-binding protein [Lentimicrobiaceae bacterium]